MIARILFATSVVALAICGVAGADSQPSHVSGKPTGIVRPVVNGTPTGSWAARNPSGPSAGAGPTKLDNLTYNGGRIMPTNKVYTIFWVPPGYSLPSAYKPLINQFFTDVAADSGKTSNVYSSDVQYSDTTHGNITYASTFAGSAVDTHALYTSDCTTPSTVSGTTSCMSDSLLQKEVKRFADAKGWPHGGNVEFFLFTAHNIESCFLSDAQAAGDPIDQACSYDYYCAYHNSFTATNGEYIYADMPYPNQTYDGFASACVDTHDGQGLPNSGGAAAGTDGAAGDEAINLISHEHNESITDPAGDAWWVNNSGSTYAGYENGDLCAWYFPGAANIGGSGATLYNQVINGHHYSVQGEWSNATATSTASSGCVWKYSPVPTNSTPPSITGTTAQGATLTGHAGTWSNAPTSYTYKWQRCSSGGLNCSLITSTSTASTTSTYVLGAADVGHTIVLRVVASNGNGAGAGVQTAPTSVVAGGKPVNSSPPTITGTAAVGQVLTAHAGTWTNTPTSYTYAWLRCDGTGHSCTSIVTVTNSSTTATHTVASADSGHTVKVRVTASNAAGTGTPVASAPTATVAAAPKNASAPTISGIAKVGQTLTANAGSWTSMPTSYAYKWYRCNSAGVSCSLVKATSSTLTSAAYKVGSLDVSHRIKLKVTASNDAGKSSTISSAPTAIVTA